mmetsp:Transcript_100422/g.322111  ORF Transcript_100422/g.322111 Transcript_100422/m.322111 type:complete len:259 (+) Transcript_100422:401-1177(+)
MPSRGLTARMPDIAPRKSHPPLPQLDGLNQQFRLVLHRPTALGAPERHLDRKSSALRHAALLPLPEACGMEAVQPMHTPLNCVAKDHIVGAQRALQAIDAGQQLLDLQHPRRKLGEPLADGQLPGLGRTPSPNRKAGGDQRTGDAEHLGSRGGGLAQLIRNPGPGHRHAVDHSTRREAGVDGLAHAQHRHRAVARTTARSATAASEVAILLPSHLDGETQLCLPRTPSALAPRAASSRGAGRAELGLHGEAVHARREG